MAPQWSERQDLPRLCLSAVNDKDFSLGFQPPAAASVEGEKAFFVCLFLIDDQVEIKSLKTTWIVFFPVALIEICDASGMQGMERCGRTLTQRDLGTDKTSAVNVYKFTVE